MSYWPIALAAAAALAASGAHAQAARPRAVVESGALSGVTADGITSFKGIPFAAPPVGALRWRAPQPAARWSGVRDAADYSHDCVQNYGGFQPKGSEPAEDCLYLNVWRPAGTTAKLPVMVWIYGGGFVNGSSSRPIYDGSRLAKQGIMVVSFNYRLGRFGTFAHPALTRANADNGLLANYGYMDQLAAMRWIHRNVAALGGDPAQVTIVGESAGGMSVHNLVTSPHAKGLFQRAVVASGGNGSPIATKSMADAEAIGAAFGQANGIAPGAPDALAKLRALPTETLRGDLALATMIRLASGDATTPRSFSSPFPDNKVAFDAGAAYRSGAFNRVPMIVGATSGDLGGRGGVMIKGARDVAGDLAKAGVPTWYYRFSYVADAAPTPKSEGAIHADDLPYYFDTVDVKYGADTKPADMAMARTIAGYLVNFVKTGDPNGGALPRWPAYRGADGTMMDFSTAGAAVVGKDPWAGDAAATGARRSGKVGSSAD